MYIPAEIIIGVIVGVITGPPLGILIGTAAYKASSRNRHITEIVSAINKAIYDGNRASDEIPENSSPSQFYDNIYSNEESRSAYDRTFNSVVSQAN
jgi:hypothetical protein